MELKGIEPSWLLVANQVLVLFKLQPQVVLRRGLWLLSFERQSGKCKVFFCTNFVSNIEGDRATGSSISFCFSATFSAAFNFLWFFLCHDMNASDLFCQVLPHSGNATLNHNCNFSWGPGYWSQCLLLIRQILYHWARPQYLILLTLRGLNPWPSPYEGAATTSELRVNKSSPNGIRTHHLWIDNPASSPSRP